MIGDVGIALAALVLSAVLIRAAILADRIARAREHDDD